MVSITIMELGLGGGELRSEGGPFAVVFVDFALPCDFVLDVVVSKNKNPFSKQCFTVLPKIFKIPANLKISEYFTSVFTGFSFERKKRNQFSKF